MSGMPYFPNLCFPKLRPAQPNPNKHKRDTLYTQTLHPECQSFTREGCHYWHQHRKGLQPQRKWGSWGEPESTLYCLHILVSVISFTAACQPSVSPCCVWPPRCGCPHSAKCPWLCRCCRFCPRLGHGGQASRSPTPERRGERWLFSLMVMQYMEMTERSRDFKPPGLPLGWVRWCHNASHWDWRAKLKKTKHKQNLFHVL